MLCGWHARKANSEAATQPRGSSLRDPGSARGPRGPRPKLRIVCHAGRGTRPAYSVRRPRQTFAMSTRRRKHAPAVHASPDRAPTSRAAWRARALWMAVTFVAAMATGWRLWEGRSGAPAIVRTADQNVLLITIDTLRADTLGCYGGPAATPALDRLAGVGTRYTFAHGHAPLTLVSHASILSGLYPFQHGIHDNSGFRFPASLPTLATMLKAQGVAT